MVFPGPCYGNTTASLPRHPARPERLMAVCLWGRGWLLAAWLCCLSRQGWPQPDSWESLGLSGS